MKPIFLAFLLLMITAHTYAVDTYHHNQVTQMSGQKYHIYIPTTRIRIRQEPSLDSKQIGLITDENDKSYTYKPHNSKWLSVNTLDGKVVGYSYKELFYKQPVAVFEDEIVTTDGTYRIEFTGYPYNPPDDYSYRQSQYRYQLFLNDKEVFTKGSKKIFQNIQLRMIRSRTDEIPTQFHSLLIQDEKVGWLFGWNKHVESYYTDLDFSFARIFIPQRDDVVFTESYEGIKFRKVADLLDKKPNQLLITPTEWQGYVFNCYKCMAYYYLPKEIMLTRKKGEVVVSKSDITINRRFIDSNPAYAYAIAFNIDDHATMKEASSRFLGELETAGELCAEHDISIEETIDTSDGYVDLEAHWQKVAEMRGYSDRNRHYMHMDSAVKAMNCLERVIVDHEFVWHTFYRTGLFPSRKTIDAYIKNRYLHVGAD